MKSVARQKASAVLIATSNFCDMKFSLLILSLWVQTIAGFSLQSGICETTSLRSLSKLRMAVDLEPEPEGGEELSPSTTVPGCRVKKMEELTNVKSDLGTAYLFWMTAEVDGTLIKEIRTKILKDASKKANFPGFRKGQVPPYAQPQITQFSIQESLITTVQSIVDAYGLKELSGSDGQVEIKEDVREMSKGYKIGDSLRFTATLNAAFVPKDSSTDSSTSGVETEADVEAS